MIWGRVIATWHMQRVSDPATLNLYDQLNASYSCELHSVLDKIQ